MNPEPNHPHPLRPTARFTAVSNYSPNIPREAVLALTLCGVTGLLLLSAELLLVGA